MAKKHLSERKTISLGDVLISTDRKTGDFEKDENGNPKRFYLKVYLPEDVDEVVLKSGDYVNFKLVDRETLDKMPDWKKDLVALSAWVPNPEYKG